MLRTITINPVLNGFIVAVGCQTLAYTDRDKLVRDIREYLEDPEKTERRILKEEGFNREHTLRDATAQPVCNTALDQGSPFAGAGMAQTANETRRC